MEGCLSAEPGAVFGCACGQRSVLSRLQYLTPAHQIPVSARNCHLRLPPLSIICRSSGAEVGLFDELWESSTSCVLRKAQSDCG